MQLGSRGEFTVLLGAESSIGLPERLFADGQPRWLGIAVQGDNAEEQRCLLVSVPYAMKAADSESLGGQPASSFVTQEQFTSRFDAGERAWSSGQKTKSSGITGITAGSGLTGGGKSGNITLAIDPQKVPLLGAANVFTGGASFAGETKITGASSDWMLVVTNTSNTSKGTLLAQAEGANLGLEGASPSGYGVEGLTTTGTGIAGKAGDGFGGFFTNNSAKWPALSAGNASGPGVLATAGTGAAGSFQNSSVSNAAVFASNSAATVGNAYGIGVQGTAAGTGAIGVYGIGTKGVGGLFTNNNATYAALAGENSSPGATAVGVYGSSSQGQGVYGTSTAGSAVYGISTSGYGLDGRSTSGNGVNGVSGTAFGVLGFWLPALAWPASQPAATVCMGKQSMETGCTGNRRTRTEWWASQETQATAASMASMRVGARWDEEGQGLPVSGATPAQARSVSSELPMTIMRGPSRTRAAVARLWRKI